jgi:hypothetical protein
MRKLNMAARAESVEAIGARAAGARAAAVGLDDA